MAETSIIDQLKEQRLNLASRRDNALAAAEDLTAQIDELDHIIAAAQPAADQWAQERLANAPSAEQP